MVMYKCFECEKVVKEEYVKKRVRCPFCGSKIIYKPRKVVSHIKAV